VSSAQPLADIARQREHLEVAFEFVGDLGVSSRVADERVVLKTVIGRRPGIRWCHTKPPSGIADYRYQVWMLASERT
jgi:hypothetical protein